VEVIEMAVTAAMIKTLREMTNAGISDCKNALTAADGDFDRAVEVLREKGLAAAAKKAGRIASEGLVAALVSDDGNKGVLVEINSETDFVAKNADFKGYVAAVAKQALNSGALELDALLGEKWVEDESVSVKDALVQKIAIIGERIDIRRFVRFEKSGSGLISTYVHGGGRVAVLLEVATDSTDPVVAEAAKNICMQIASMSPQFVSKDEIPAEVAEKEAEIAKQLTITEESEKLAANPDYKKKNEKILESITKSRAEKQLADITLASQGYVRDGELPEQETKGKKVYTVADYLKYVGSLAGSPITVKRFARFETGEGLAKKEEDFAAEVSKAMMV
jgi:elongation factor Ts